MPKHLTSVLATLGVIILFAAVNPAAAQSTTTPRETSIRNDCRDSERRSEMGYDNYQDCVRSEMALIGEGNNDGAVCNSAKSSYDQAAREFQDACAAAGMNMAGTSSGQFACSNQVVCCVGQTSQTSACDSGSLPSLPTGSQDRSNVLDDLIRDGTERLSNADPSTAPAINSALQNAQLEQQYLNCPSRARGGLEQATEDAEAAREKLEEKQEKLVELQEELQLAQIEKEEKLDEVKNELQEEKLRTADRLDELEANLEDEQNRLADEIKRMQDLIQTANEDKARVHEAVDTANNEKLAKEDELYLECLERAEGIIRRDREACIQAAANVNAQGAQRSQGCSKSMSDIFAGQGQTLVQRMQQGIDREIEICKADERYKKRYQLLQRTHFRTVDALSTQMTNINARIENINQDILELQTDDMSSLLRNNIKALNRLNERHSSELDRLNRKASLAAQRADAKIASIQRKIQLYMQHVQSAEQTMQAREAALAIRQQYAGGAGSVDQQAFGQAVARYQSYRSAAQNYQLACCNPPDGTSYGSAASSCPTVTPFVSRHINELGLGRMIANDPDSRDLLPGSETN
ncbi:MAG: hypothetical protein HRT45_12795 [Bdellovibrionales bacterium]|nr:hypothetical protein [Bdellovibrionales bacterium]